MLGKPAEAPAVHRGRPTPDALWKSDRPGHVRDSWPTVAVANLDASSERSYDGYSHRIGGRQRSRGDRTGVVGETPFSNNCRPTIGKRTMTVCPRLYRAHNGKCG